MAGIRASYWLLWPYCKYFQDPKSQYRGFCEQDPLQCCQQIIHFLHNPTPSLPLTPYPFFLPSLICQTFFHPSPSSLNSNWHFTTLLAFAGQQSNNCSMHVADAVAVDKLIKALTNSGSVRASWKQWKLRLEVHSCLIQMNCQIWTQMNRLRCMMQ